MSMNDDKNTPSSSTKEPSIPLNAKEEATEFVKTALIAVFLALLIRTFIFEPFSIPSGSMKPTLLVGDYLFVNKPAYGYSRYSFPFGLAPLQGRVWEGEPKRGDVVVFKLPTNTYVDYIKRVIGMPGDTVQVMRGRLYINGELVHREAIGHKQVSNVEGHEYNVIEYLETLPGGATHSIYEESDMKSLDNTPLYTVPEGHYFMMGDNRDHSQDSRVRHAVGFVPFENFVGRADFIFHSTNGHARIYEFWKWPWTVRYDRLFNDIDPVRLTRETTPAQPKKIGK
ncbi:MAG: signal peptidase I [Micavibrio sp. TMED27]|nr:signal peptidase I [Micavibrio sp.]OUT90457.1 MAG: signal peptidase I [Micavibrio sp. TMED27]